MMPQFFIVKNGKRFSIPAFLFCFPLVVFVFCSEACPPIFFLFCVLDLLVLLLGHERINPFKMVLKGHIQGACLHQEVTLMEVLLTPISINYALTLFRSITISGLMSDPRDDPTLVDAPIGYVSREDPLPFDIEEEASTGLVRQDTRTNSKPRLSWLDSPHVKSTETSSLGRCLLRGEM